MNKLHHKKVDGRWSANHLPTISRPPADHLPTTNRPLTNHLLTKHLPTTYRPSIDHLPTSYRPLTDHLPTTYRPPTNHLPTTYRPPTNHLPTTYRPLFLQCSFFTITCHMYICFKNYVYCQQFLFHLPDGIRFCSCPKQVVMPVGEWCFQVKLRFCFCNSIGEWTVGTS